MEQPNNGFIVTPTLMPNNDISPYGVLESAWLLPAILFGTRNEIWANLEMHSHPIYHFWVHMGWIDQSKSMLSPQGAKMVALRGLFEYEFGMMHQQLEGDFETKPEAYSQLRGGLEQYSNIYLEFFVDWVAAFIPANGVILDMAGGKGALSKRILIKRPDVTVHLIDKTIEASGTTERLSTEEVDILENFDWFYDRIDTYDLVLMSEFLHCLPEAQRLTVLGRARHVIIDGGVIVSIEQHVNLRLEWRLHDMTNGNCLSNEQTMAELKQFGDLYGIRNGATHYGVAIKIAHSEPTTEVNENDNME